MKRKTASVFDAEGGTRTRTAFRPTDFLTTTAFAAPADCGIRIGDCGLTDNCFVSPQSAFCNPQSNWVCGLDDAFSVHPVRTFRREPSRLYTLLSRCTDSLSSALPSARSVKGSPTLTPFAPVFPAGVLKQLSPLRLPFRHPGIRGSKITWPAHTFQLLHSPPPRVLECS